MAKLPLYDISGKSIGEIEASANVFASPPNEAVVHAALVAFSGSQRAGTASTKTRAEVRGGGKKPWAQKGTGRARAGSLRSPLFVGGGVIFGPKPRKFRNHLPKKMKRKALRVVLSDKVKEGKVKVVDELKLDEIKTKKMVEILKALGVAGQKVLMLLGSRDEKTEKSARNIKDVKMASIGNLNIYDLLKYENLILTRDSAKVLEEVLK